MASKHLTLLPFISSLIFSFTLHQMNWASEIKWKKQSRKKREYIYFTAPLPLSMGELPLYSMSLVCLWVGWRVDSQFLFTIANAIHCSLGRRRHTWLATRLPVSKRRSVASSTAGRRRRGPNVTFWAIRLRLELRMQVMLCWQEYLRWEHKWVKEAKGKKKIKEEMKRSLQREERKRRRKSGEKSRERRERKQSWVNRKEDELAMFLLSVLCLICYVWSIDPLCSWENWVELVCLFALLVYESLPFFLPSSPWHSLLRVYRFLSFLLLSSQGWSWRQYDLWPDETCTARADRITQVARPLLFCLLSLYLFSSLSPCSSCSLLHLPLLSSLVRVFSAVGLLILWSIKCIICLAIHSH